MPSNKREGIYYGLMMVFGMVLIMSIYNMYLNGLSTLTVQRAILQFVLTFVVAFLVESFLVGPIAKSIAFKIPYDKSKKIYVIIAISSCMVVGMVICMSFFGLVTKLLNSSLEGSILKNYGMILIKNFIVAYPLQLLIMGPLVRWLFVKFVKSNNSAAV